MYNLILKEFLIQKKTLLYGLLYTLFATFAFKDLFPKGGTIYTIAPIAVIYLFVNYSCGFDDKSKADVIFNSLPIKREDIVISKYLSIFFFAAYGIICSSLLGLIGLYTGFPSVTRLISFDDIVIVLASGIIFGSTFYPLYFKFGMVKMKFVNIFLFMIIMFLPSLIVEYAASLSQNTAVKHVELILLNTPVWIFKMLLAIVAFIIFLVSILVSMNIYKGKEF